VAAFLRIVLSRSWSNWIYYEFDWADDK